MESCNKKYFTQTIIDRLDDDSSFGAVFKDKELEKKYVKLHLKKQLKNTMLYTIIILILNSASLVFNFMVNETTSLSSYFLLGGLIIDFGLAHVNNRFQNSYTYFKSVKYIRFFVVYINIAIFCILYGTKVSNPTNCVRTTYVFILLINCFYLLFLDYNFYILILIPVFNTLIICTIQKIRQYSYYELLPEVFINILYHYSCFLLKKNENFQEKKSFLRNEHYNEYFHNLVDTLNTLIICIKKDGILFMNMSSLSFFERKKKKISRSLSISLSEEYKDNESLFNQQKEIHIEKNKTIYNFFQSISLISGSNNRYPEGRSLKDIIKTIFDSSVVLKKFEKIGIFSNSEKNLAFEIQVRKFKVNEEVIELLINDITDIKVAEKESIEARNRHKILAKIAHEFKTPLLTIQSLVDKNIETQENSENVNSNVSNNLYYISNLSKYTLILISDITQFALGFVDLKINIEEVDIKEVLEFSYNILKTLIECNDEKSKNVIPVIEIDNNLSEVIIESDINRLKQIILNFISNSFKFTFSGFIKLKAIKLKGDDEFEISVKDSGIGIREEDQKLIFQENPQITINQTYNKHGSGYGLTIAKSLAENMNCKVGFKSEYGKGSKFFIRLKCFSSAIFKPKKMSLAIGRNIFPYQLTDTDNFSERKSDRRFDREIRESCEDQLILNKKEVSLDKKVFFSATKEAIDLENEDNHLKGNLNESHDGYVERNKIMVVDDHKIIRSTTKNVIKEVMNSNESSKYDLIECSDGIDLLYHIKLDVENRIKLILIDENMVYLNGSETVKIIRKLESDNKIRHYPIVSITGITDEENRKLMLSSGFDLVVPKPCSKTQIRKLLNFFNLSLGN